MSDLARSASVAELALVGSQLSILIESLRNAVAYLSDGDRAGVQDKLVAIDGQLDTLIADMETLIGNRAHGG